MLESLSIGLLSFFLQLFGHSPTPLQAMPLMDWQQEAIFAVPTQGDPVVEKIVADYLQKLSEQGINPELQGIWIQSMWAELANHRSNLAASAASLTKIATTLAALETWGPAHRFETRIYHTGAIQKGILQGDLIIEGSGDPLFVWEEAIALGNALHQLGITQVKGNLVITGDFSMNFQSSPQVSGALLMRGVNSSLWPSGVEQEYQKLPQKPNRPQLVITGKVQESATVPTGAQLLLRHQSLTVVELVKQMNIYSNNAMAEMLAKSVGGAEKVAQIAIQVAQVSPQEIRLINGSGLGVDNRISPQAVCQILMAIQRKYEPQSITLADLFPVAGLDKKGTMKWRHLPQGVAIKTGTLAQVSALAGVIPTQERGLVWFSIQNSGSPQIDKFRADQDQLLQSLASHWQVLPSLLKSSAKEVFLGDPTRNLKAQS
ncbi:D-alanyl-D-alanine carboxypeptidase/D-alanyl-D-alanine-endopeptidase [Gloeothece verrucosa]|uniref:D-alanyl-D-alanine carboxypeptidase/D-alanyl-D-alanine-endopeptidase n=1 Tax=Gloeothece verrucosa (strain PCC 7822) TaxID=497965 RepID=E0U5J1_GLOV7|nr:D-alanyl-D-alanine carboxypeptidase [Gloeothece verrucosa]ADN14704.1 D-alanyl-D-alanine carboxypeptidase/D-alanyl-D-alanine-endopeptidase [Gloeothece verrucosa PCC 7822]